VDFARNKLFSCKVIPMKLENLGDQFCEEIYAVKQTRVAYLHGI
jgi:hypothetical protein